MLSSYLGTRNSEKYANRAHVCLNLNVLYYSCWFIGRGDHFSEGIYVASD